MCATLVVHLQIHLGIRCLIGDPLVQQTNVPVTALCTALAEAVLEEETSKAKQARAQQELPLQPWENLSKESCCVQKINTKQRHPDTF